MRCRHFLCTRTLLLAGALALCLDGMEAHGAVTLGATRIIMDGAKGEAVVRLANGGLTPVLIQTWLDRGDPDEDPAHIRIPFLVTNPVFRLEAGDSRMLHIVRVSSGEDDPPAKQESAFWLNVLEVPAAAPPEPGMVRLQMAATSRIKFFYRPPGLDATVDKAAGSLQFTLQQDADAQTLLVGVFNPAPLHVTITHVALRECGHSTSLLDIRPQDSMIGPGQRRTFPASPATAPPLPAGRDLCITFHYIDDYGSVVEQRPASPVR